MAREPKKKSSKGKRKRAGRAARPQRLERPSFADVVASGASPDAFIPNPEGPFVEFAGLCAAVEDDTKYDGTAIRGITEGTRLHLAPPRDKRKGHTVEVGTKLYVRLRGGARGEHELTIFPRDPLGRAFNVISSIEEFPGNPQGISEVMLPIRFPASPPGLFRIDVFMDGIFLTRVLFRLEFNPGLIPGRPPLEAP